MLRRFWHAIFVGHDWILYGRVEVQPEGDNETMVIAVAISAFVLKCACGAAISANNLCIHTPGGMVQTRDPIKDEEVEQLRKMVGLQKKGGRS